MKYNNIGVYLVIAGLLMILLMAGSASREALPDLGRLDNDDFSIGISTYKTPVVAGDENFWVIATIQNLGRRDGEMYAQCSLFDYNLHSDWINTYARQAAIDVSIRLQKDNCVDYESFTQTAKIELDAGETEDYLFTITVPEGLDTKNAILWCGTFERCYSSTMEGNNPIGASDSDYIKELPVQAASTVTTTTPGTAPASSIPPNEYACELDRDCPSYFTGATKCENGYCVDVPPEEINLDNTNIINWARAHSIIIFMLGVALILFGVYFIYEKP